jgi:hypothetical protein
MPPWLSNLLQNRAFWAAVLFIGIPVIRAIISAAAKARERKLALDRVRATELETLRTGPRPSGEQPMSARQQLETMAAQRRAELDRMRAQRSASSPAPPPMPASVPAAASQQSARQDLERLAVDRGRTRASPSSSSHLLRSQSGTAICSDRWPVASA